MGIAFVGSWSWRGVRRQAVTLHLALDSNDEEQICLIPWSLAPPQIHFIQPCGFVALVFAGSLAFVLMKCHSM